MFHTTHKFKFATNIRKAIIMKSKDEKQYECKCRNKDEFPFEKKCSTLRIIYEADIITLNTSRKFYIRFL